MPFNDIEQLRLKRVVGEFCRNWVPVHLRNQIKIFYEVRGFGVRIIESRPAFGKDHEWKKHSIARMKYDPDTLKWQLYWRQASGRWVCYPGFKPTNRLRTLIEEIEQDPHNVFWG